MQLEVGVVRHPITKSEYAVRYRRCESGQAMLVEATKLDYLMAGHARSAAFLAAVLDADPYRAGTAERLGFRGRIRIVEPVPGGEGAEAAHYETRYTLTEAGWLALARAEAAS